MIRLSLRSMLSRKLRTALTALAVFLGVTMISGTFVLTDQIKHGFDAIYQQAYSMVDVVVTPKVEFGSTAYGPVGYLPQDLIGTVGTVDGVAAADGYVYGLGSVVIDGKPIATGGAPTLVYSYMEGFEPDKYVSGSPPAAGGEVGIIKQLADSKKLAVGDTIGLTTEQGTEQVKVAGIFTFGDSPSLGGATVVHTTLADAQAWYNAAGQVSEIYVRAVPGISPDVLKSRIEAVVPAGAVVKTGAQTAVDTTKQINDGFVGPIRSVLLIFGLIAVLVGGFIIFNTFSITVAQRLREFAMIRTLGATRRQVLGSVIGEALALGVTASVAGLVGGLAAARVLNALFHAVGADIPASGIGLQTSTIVVSLAVGIGITLVSAVFPAFRATRVAPIAALREGAELPPGRFARYTPYAAALLAAVGVAALVRGATGGGSTTHRLISMGVGVAVILIATALVSRIGVPLLVRLVGWPPGLVAGVRMAAPLSVALVVSALVGNWLVALVAVLLAAAVGFSSLARRGARAPALANARLAQENSMRNPGRTAATAAAMMIGLAVVVFVAVFAESLKSTFVDSFDRLTTAQYVVVDGRNQGPTALPGGALDAVRIVPGVQDASGITMQRVMVDGGAQASLLAIDPAAIGSLWRFDWRKGGSDSLLGELNGSAALVEEQTALDRGLSPGSKVEVLTQQGKKASLEIIGEFRDPVMMNGLVVSDTTFAGLFEGNLRNPWYILVGTSDGRTSDAARSGLDAALKPFPNLKASTKQQYIKDVSKAINQALMIFYALLAMSVIISLFGIVNTLVLAVYERTREIGMLRAIGTTRPQMRRVVRYESVITAVIGALLGMVLGLAFGFAVVTVLAGQGIRFALPVGQIVGMLVVAIIAGIIAAVVPARRAARLNILEAIHYE